MPEHSIMASLNDQQRRALVAAVDAQPALNGQTGVAFIGLGASSILRQPLTPPGLQTWVVFRLEETDSSGTGPSGSHARGVEGFTATGYDVAGVAKAPPISRGGGAPDESAIGRELLSLGLNCGGAVLAGVVTLGTAAAAPATGFTSLLVVKLPAAAAVAAAASCGLSIGRVFNEIANDPLGRPHLDERIDAGSNESLDRWAPYRYGSLALDAVQVASGVASLGSAARAAVHLGRAKGGQSWFGLVRDGMSRSGRERLRFATANKRDLPAIWSRQELKQLAKQGKIPHVLTATQVSRSMVNHLLDSVAASMAFAESLRTGTLSVFIFNDE
jgi:hypothetical protein